MKEKIDTLQTEMREKFASLNDNIQAIIANQAISKDLQKEGTRKITKQKNAQ